MNGFDRGGVMMLCGLQKNDGILLGKIYDTKGIKIEIGITGNLNQG